eukprot:4126894-Prymnesium_polylepis.1
MQLGASGRKKCRFTSRHSTFEGSLLLPCCATRQDTDIPSSRSARAAPTVIPTTASAATPPSGRSCWR